MARAEERPKRRVLIINDNRDAAESLSCLLKFFENDVEIAHDGPQGLHLARSFSPQVVLCDLGLPGMDGTQVAEAIRADPVLRSIRLVALTGYDRDEDLERAVGAGFDEHLTKPVDPDRLMRALG